MGIFRNLFRKLKVISKKTQGIEEQKLTEELIKIRKEINRKQTELTETRLKIDENIHSLKSDETSKDFIPPFHIWCGFPEILEMSIEDALYKYISKYNLLIPSEPDEPISLTKIAVMLDILRSSREKFDKSIINDLDKYIFSLQCNLAIEKMNWEVQKKQSTLNNHNDNSDG